MFENRIEKKREKGTSVLFSKNLLYSSVTVFSLRKKTFNSLMVLNIMNQKSFNKLFFREERKRLILLHNVL